MFLFLIELQHLKLKPIFQVTTGTILHVAKMSDEKLKVTAQEGDIDLLYTVIQHDPYVLENIDSIPFVNTPLHIAASCGHLQFATEIMRLKPSFAWKLNPQGFTPIHVALQHGHNRVVLRFVDINKDLVRAKGREGLTPLHFVSQVGEIDLLAEFLLLCPDSIQDVTVRSETVLHIAVKNLQYEVLQVLLGWLKKAPVKGAAKLEKTLLNWKDETGNTILHISALTNKAQVVQWLVKTKIDLEAKNSEDKTSLDLATNEEIRSILKRVGAKCGSSITYAPTFADKLKSKITESFRQVQVTEGLWVVPKWCTPQGNMPLPDSVYYSYMVDGCIKGGEHILDYGTGTGILAISALKAINC
ncbi:hypothetical protein VNO78_06493 [Psophocarpus tetragonolobus]|uniref:Uncharacterized protein n=1 Tax=Psophocarpus tetragonolobus TaxID=3891 RepID=A0AAN9XR71_PSOTE